ncbi:GNAT family protein [Kitasatospora sp. NPDC004723]|uniref:GNAT family protein n=1 Tax=Kitasatospora sp. NPDC004723 TaxID=3154288 RepID=UPI0033B82699
MAQPTTDATVRCDCATNSSGSGATEDGRIRDHVFVHGAWRDSITYSILEHEWASD